MVKAERAGGAGGAGRAAGAGGSKTVIDSKRRGGELMVDPG